MAAFTFLAGTNVLLEVQHRHDVAAMDELRGADAELKKAAAKLKASDEELKHSCQRLADSNELLLNADAKLKATMAEYCYGR